MANLVVKTELDDKKVCMIRNRNAYIVTTERIVHDMYTLDYVLRNIGALAASIKVCLNRLDHVICSYIKYIAYFGD